MFFIRFKFLFILYFLLLACGFRILGVDSLELFPTSSFSVGENNGQPGSQNDTLVEEEFSILSAEGNTVQVRDVKSFPQILQPEQRIALFLENLDLNSSYALESVIVCQPDPENEKTPAIEILINDKPIYDCSFEKGPLTVSAFIPVSYLEKGSNLVQIRNAGPFPFAFDYLKVAPMMTSLKTDKVTELPDDIKTKLNDINKLNRLGIGFHKKMSNLIPYEIVSHIRDNHALFSFEEAMKNGNLYDPVSGGPNIFYFSLLIVSRIFEGNPSVIPANLISCDKERIPSSLVSWTAVLNTEGVVTLQIASKSPFEKSVKVVIPVSWSGKTKCVMNSGIIPENLKDKYPDFPKISSTSRIIEISNGIFEDALSLKETVNIRLIKDGEKEPTSPVLHDKAVPAVFKKGILNVGNSRELSDNIICELRSPDSFISANSSNYVIKTKVDATKDKIDKYQNVVPWDGTSDSVEISYPDGKSFPCEGVNIYYAGCPKTYKDFSFWVYPGTVGPFKKVTLQFYIENEKGYQFLAADLKIGEWQRVILPSDKIRLQPSGRLCFVGDPRLPEYAKGNKVSFELNGFCTTGNEHSEKGKSGLQKSRIAGTDKEKTFVLIGRPDSYFEYRQAFKEPVEIESISELSGYEGLKYVYKKDAQILEISGNFPKNNDENNKSKSILTTDEKITLDEKQSSCLIVKMTL